ncbi:MAG: hypothetical protein EOP93_12845 [Lysobacteraceae bacterium]|nr:MAG: hypothetical protein EOP93_12845 [Xanthomonadaceae bacterium]
MRVDGFWRIWVGASLAWAALVLALAFLVLERPSAARVAAEVGAACGLGLPVPPDLAEGVRGIPALAAQLAAPGSDATAVAGRTALQAVRATVEAVAARAGKAAQYNVYLARDAGNTRHIVVVPVDATEAQVFAHMEHDRRAADTWERFGRRCDARLRAQARDALYPALRNQWAGRVLAVLLSLPLLALLPGFAFGWARPRGSTRG